MTKKKVNSYTKYILLSLLMLLPLFSLIQGRSIDGEAITPEGWRAVNLECATDNGNPMRVELLRPLWWLEENEIAVGADHHLVMPELNVDEVGQVTAIGPCTVDSSNTPKGHSLVTGRFITEKVPVLDLVFEGKEQAAVGATDSHPFWSVDRQDWIHAGDLEVGEQVKTADGETLALKSAARRPGLHTVINLEVQEDHVYYVSDSAILVHNTGCPPKQLQKKYKHAKDFGVSGNYSKANAQKFQEAIQEHIMSSSTRKIKGTYRGQSVLHHLDSNTGLNVITDESGTFISGWKLGQKQLEHIFNHGGLN
jgi:colicin D/pretoxin HINT domain-containing protein